MCALKNQDNKKYCDRESRDNSKEIELEILTDQYKRWDYSSKVKPRITNESVEKFAPTDLTNRSKKPEVAQVKKPEQKKTEEDTRDERNVNKEYIRMKEQDYTKKMLKMLLPMVVSVTIPLLILGAPVWLMTIVDLIILSPMLFWSVGLSVIVPYAYYIARPILYVWALVVAILGVQDFFAIAFYVLMAIQVPSMIINFIGTILSIIMLLTGNRK